LICRRQGANVIKSEVQRTASSRPATLPTRMPNPASSSLVPRRSARNNEVVEITTPSKIVSIKPVKRSCRPRRHDEPILNKAVYATIAGSILRTLIAYGLIFWVGLRFGGVTYARTMLFTSIVLHAFTRVMVVRQLDNLSLWSNKALLWSYAIAVGLQLLVLYTPLRNLFGIVLLDWRAWAVMVPVVAGSSLTGEYMTRWILKLIPLWEA